MATLAEGTIGTGTELAYIAGLVISGLILVIVAAIGFNRPTIGVRILSGLIGVAMLGYGAYLFLGDPDSVYIFWYVFIVPIALIVQIFKARRTGGGVSIGQPNNQVSYGGQQPFQSAPSYPPPGGYQPQPGAQQAFQPQPGQQAYQPQPGQQSYQPQPGQQSYQPQPGYPQPGYPQQAPQAPQGQPQYPQGQGYPQSAQPPYPGQPQQPTPWQNPPQQG